MVKILSTKMQCTETCTACTPHNLQVAEEQYSISQWLLPHLTMHHLAYLQS